jgi:homospermidine synthase
MSNEKSESADESTDSWGKLVAELGVRAPKKHEPAAVAKAIFQRTGELFDTETVRGWRRRGSVPAKIFVLLSEHPPDKKSETVSYVGRGVLFSERFAELSEAVQLRMLDMVERGEIKKSGAG